MKQNPQEAAGLEPEDDLANQKQEPQIDPQVTINAVGLDPNDPEVTKILSDNDDPTEALIQLSNSRKRTSAPSTIMPTSGGNSAPEADLWEQYKAEVAPYRGNVRMVSKVQAKYAKLGLPV